MVTTNCSNNYGPYQFPEKLIPLVLLNALEGKPLPIYGDGKQIRDWLYVEDHCTGILAALTKGQVGETYCIGGRSEMENIQIVQRICAILDELLPASENANLDGKDSCEDLITYVKIDRVMIDATPSIAIVFKQSMAGAPRKPSILVSAKQ